MTSFVWPYVFFLLPLPWIIGKILPIKPLSHSAALKAPNLEDLQTFQQATLGSSSIWKSLFLFLIWIGLLASAARPQWVGEPIEIPQSGRDLMLAVDLSGSMQTKDFEISGQNRDRLTALKLIAGDFIDRRQGDRLGLILFGTNAYLQVPLTFDAATVKQLLMESAVGLAGTNTAIGDAIGLAIKQLRDNPESSRVLILMTDGRNTAGALSLDKAAEIAAREKLKIYTIAIGSTQMNIPSIFGARSINPSADIDEESLKMVAEKTGGKYFRAYSTHELVQIYKELDQLERLDHKGQFYRPTEEMYYWPLAVSLIGIALLMSFACLRGVKA